MARVLTYLDEDDSDEEQVEVANAFTPEEAETAAALQRHEYYVREIEYTGGVVTISPILRYKTI